MSLCIAARTPAPCSTTSRPASAATSTSNTPPSSSRRRIASGSRARRTHDSAQQARLDRDDLRDTENENRAEEGRGKHHPPRFLAMRLREELGSGHVEKEAHE